MYYLNSRYYNPEVGRFINADGIIGTLENQQAYNLYSYVGNNPVNLFDENGDFALATTSVAGAFATRAVVGVVVVCGYEIVRTGVKGIVQIISQSKSNTKVFEKSKKKKEKKKNNGYAVYTLTDENTEVVMYVGRTKDVVRREKEHKKSNRGDLIFATLKGGITKEEASGLEQASIMHFRTLNKGKPLANQINGIAWDNKRCSEYMNAVTDLVKKLFDESETYVGYCKY